MGDYIIAIDQGTTSSRAIIFDKRGDIVSDAQKEHRQVIPEPGWIEHDPVEIWRNVHEVIAGALGKARLTRYDIAAIGIANQRETTVVWDRTTGHPIHNALVWQDTRMRRNPIGWILEHIAGAREKANAGGLFYGTIDTWILWNLTGGKDRGVHLTDVTNASCTPFMDIETLDWRGDTLADSGVPLGMMPEIRSSSERYAVCEVPLLRGVPVTGILGDQQAAAFGHGAFEAGESKNTYGTGSFLVFQTGENVVHSRNGLVTTVGYKLGEAPPRYALEGSIAVTGSLIQWLRDQLGIIASASEVEDLAADDNGGVYFVPAFSGLFAPHWRPDARGAIVGLTRYATKAHIARAALEAAAFQTREVIDALKDDSGEDLAELKVDGGMTANSTLMQFQADILGVPVVRPVVTETTALGAAYAAGLAVGFWSGVDELRTNWRESQRWEPRLAAGDRDRVFRLWRKAVSKSVGWVAEAE